MIDHLTLNVSSFEKSKPFFEQALAALGFRLHIEMRAEQHEGQPTCAFADGRSGLFWILQGSVGQPPPHVAFKVDTREEVDRFHHAALAAGGRDNGAPGIRPHQYHLEYYAAFVRDPDGANIEAVCHGAVAPAA